MNTYIVATVIASGNPDHPPQIDMWAVRTSSLERAESMIREMITIPLMAITVRSLNDGAANALGMQDDFRKSL